MITDDQLNEQLRAANPFPPTRSLTDLDRQSQEALYEEIVNVSDAELTPASQPARRTRPIVASAAAIAAAAAVAYVVVRDGDDGTRVATTVSAATVTAATTDDSSPVVSMPSIGIGSCVEVYSLETLPNRTLAFDGTVSLIDGNQVTFTVHHWYKGGESPSVTLDGNGMTGGAITSAGGPALVVGDRFLVAGDDGFVWSCGFTQPFNEALAQAWSNAFKASAASDGG